MESNQKEMAMSFSQLYLALAIIMTFLKWGGFLPISWAWIIFGPLLVCASIILVILLVGVLFYFITRLISRTHNNCDGDETL